jgi:hypothetical protein
LFSNYYLFKVMILSAKPRSGPGILLIYKMPENEKRDRPEPVPQIAFSGGWSCALGAITLKKSRFQKPLLIS